MKVVRPLPPFSDPSVSTRGTVQRAIRIVYSRRYRLSVTVVTRANVQVTASKAVPAVAYPRSQGRTADIPPPVRFGEPLTGRMEPMPLTLDAAFWRRVYADRQRVHDERERVT